MTVLFKKPKKAIMYEVLADASRAYRVKPDAKNAAFLLRMYGNMSKVLKAGVFPSTLILTALTEGDISEMVRTIELKIEAPSIILHVGDEVDAVRQGLALAHACMSLPLIDEPMIDSITDFIEQCNFNGAKPEEAGAFLLNHYGERALAGYQ